MPDLITAALSQQAYRLHRTLNNSDTVFADISELPFIPGREGIVIPSYHSMSFTHEILKICLDYHISRVFPLVFGEIAELSKARMLFSEYDISLIIPSDSWLRDNPPQRLPDLPEILVWENGSQIAGPSIGETEQRPDENGVFCRTSHGKQFVYNLFVI